VRAPHTKKQLYDELTPLSKFISDLREAAAPSNGGDNGGGGPLPVGGDTEIDPDDGD
jgi:hypothetical protein